MRYPGFGPTVAILGGGQLGRMLVRKAGQLGFGTRVLDPDPDSPAGQLSTEQVVAPLDDARALERIVAGADVATFELEEIPVAPLLELERHGAVIRPAPSLLQTLQDKHEQKRFFAQHGLPTCAFEALDAPDVAGLEAFGLPLVQKSRRGGYDGRGVEVFRDRVDAERILRVPSVLERFVPCAMELAVVVARRASGEVRSFPAVEMMFAEANVLEFLVAPARLPDEVLEAARRLAERTVSVLQGVGVFGVEMFLDRSGGLLLNEVAPRVHNSGHHTIEACRTDQFEQHLRAVLGLPLGDPTQHSAAVMVNVLGAQGSEGPAHMEGLEAVMAIPGVSLHMYAKQQSRPGRKMGHLTVVHADLEQALAHARTARECFNVVGGRPA